VAPDRVPAELALIGPEAVGDEQPTAFGGAQGRPDRLGVARPEGNPQLIVVAGDASVIGKPLSRFGEVVVLDPEKEFATVSTIPADPNAALE